MDAKLTQTSDREQQLGEVLALLLEAAERGEALDRAGWLTHHPEFAAELSEFFNSGDRLRSVAAPLREAVFATTPISERTPSPFGDGGFVAGAGQQFGAYELLEEVGRGGMGVVFKARQTSPARVVALKVLRTDLLRGDEQVRRFRNEAELAALLDHPHIVPVYEVGEQAGQLYFSMKLVEGGSLAEHLGRFRDDPKAAAGLLAQVARAVHHAHQRGVLHRDLKPANVLLDSAGRPHVADFGLARRLEGDSSLTGSGVIVGTPSYLAPEQVSGKKGAVTTATDVYGLGAILYALLTGRPPFQADTPLETLALVREREPDPPRRFNPRADRDLETVCLKCLNKDPNQRYPSAAAVADDLERWLRGEPILARRSSAWRRAAKWARRRPALAALLAVSVLAALASVAGVLWHNAQLREAAQRERHLAVDAEQQRQEAQEKRREARRAYDKMYSRVADDWLAKFPALEKGQREFLEDALQYYQGLSQEDDTDPAVPEEKANAYTRLGKILNALGRRKEAAEAYERAIATWQGLAAEHPDVEDYPRSLADCYRGLGNVRSGMGDARGAAASQRQAVAILEQLVRDFPDNLGYRSTLAGHYNNLAIAVYGDRQQAEELLRKSQALLEELADKHPEDASFHWLLGGTLNSRARLRLFEGNSAEARRLVEKAIRHGSKAVDLDRGNRNYREFLRNHYVMLAKYILRPQGDVPKALVAARQALTLADELAAQFPDVAHYRGMKADSLDTLGLVLQDANKAAEAVDAYRQALVILEGGPAGPFEQQLLHEVRVNLSVVLIETGDDRGAIAQCEKVLQADPSDRIAANNLAVSLANAADPADRNPARALQLAQAAVRQDPGNARMQATLGFAHYRVGDWKSAAASLEEARRLDGDRLHPVVGYFLAMTCWQRHQPEEARQWFDRASQAATRTPPTREGTRARAEAAALLGTKDGVAPNKEGSPPKDK